MTSSATVCIELLDDVLQAHFHAMIAGTHTRTMLTWHEAGLSTTKVVIASQSHHLNMILLKSKKIWILLSKEPVHEDNPKVVLLSPDCTESELVSALDTACLKLLKADATGTVDTTVSSTGISAVQKPVTPVTDAGKAADSERATARKPGDLYRVLRWIKLKPAYSELRFSRAMVAMTRDSVSWKGLMALGLSDADARSFLRELADQKVLVITRELDVAPASGEPVPYDSRMLAARALTPGANEKKAPAERGSQTRTAEMPTPMSRLRSL